MKCHGADLDLLSVHPERPARDFSADFSFPYWPIIAFKTADAEKADLGSGHL